MLNKSIFKKVTAFLATLSIFLIVPFFSEPVDTNGNQKCEKESWWKSYNCKLKEANLLDFDKVESFSIIVVAILYVLGSDERKKQVQQAEEIAKEQAFLQRWQLIDGARGIETSGARFKALEELHKDGHILKGFDANRADLIGINLSGANLRRANLKRALLINANLRDVDLRQAKLQKAELRGANLQEANLWFTNLEGADLQECEAEDDNALPLKERVTNLQGANLGKSNLKEAILNNANLQNANLSGADLSGADLRGADIEGANFSKANIKGAIFGGVKNLDIDQISQAKNYQEARYDKDFCSKYPDRGLTEYEVPKVEKIEKKLKDITTKEEVTPQLLQQIQEFIKFTKNGDLLQDDPQVKKIITFLDKFADSIKKDNSISNDCKKIIAEIGRGLRGKFYKDLNDRACVYEETEGDKRDLDGDIRKHHESDAKLTREWLKDEDNIQLLKEKAINYFLTEIEQNNLTSNKDCLYLVEKDIETCLKLMLKLNKIKIEEINLHFPCWIYIKIFEFISEQLIPELESEKYDNLDTYVSRRLSLIFGSFVKRLKDKQGSVTKIK